MAIYYQLSRGIPDRGEPEWGSWRFHADAKKRAEFLINKGGVTGPFHIVRVQTREEGMIQ